MGRNGIPVSPPPIGRPELELLRATRRRPRDATASAFADWVFQVIVAKHPRRPEEPRSRLQRLKMGRFLHTEVEQQFAAFSEYWGKPMGASEWLLEYADDNASPSAEPFTCSRIRLRGLPVRARPDVVFRHRVSGAVLVIERKFTLLEVDRIPGNGWPNLQAQLWCYGWIDAWRDAPEVYLTGQIRHAPWLWERRRRGNYFVPRVKWDVATWWRRSDSRFHNTSVAAFEAAGGEWRS
jgi:hypothetical protein